MPILPTISLLAEFRLDLLLLPTINGEHAIKMSKAIGAETIGRRDYVTEEIYRNKPSYCLALNKPAYVHGIASIARDAQS